MLWARSCDPGAIYDPWRVLRRLQMPHQPQDLRRKGKEGLKALHHNTLSGPGKLLFFLSEAFVAASVGARLGDEMGQRG